MTPAQKRRLKTLITYLVNTEIAVSWSGRGDPAGIPWIKLERDQAKNALNKYLNFLTEEKPTFVVLDNKKELGA